MPPCFVFCLLLWRGFQSAVCVWQGKAWLPSSHHQGQPHPGLATASYQLFRQKDYPKAQGWARSTFCTRGCAVLQTGLEKHQVIFKSQSQKYQQQNPKQITKPKPHRQTADQPSTQNQKKKRRRRGNLAPSSHRIAIPSGPGLLSSCPEGLWDWLSKTVISMAT